MEGIFSNLVVWTLAGIVMGATIAWLFIRLYGSRPRKRKFRGKFLGGRYKIGFELGRGMNAVTYRVEDNMSPTTPLAAKVLLTPEEEPRVSRSSFNRHVRRFRREIENLKKLKGCKFVVPLYDFHADNIEPFFVMHLCDGSLQDELTQVPLRMNVILDVILDVCEGLQEIHDRKIIHRDLKPANILKHEGRWVLADFGMSLMGEYGGVVTVPDSLPGTIPYTAPEVMYSEPGAIGPPADIFSFGITLKAMFTGVNTYEVKTSALLPGRINMKTKRQIKLFDELIEEMTRMEPNDRLQSVSDIANKIERIFEEVNKIEGKKREILFSNKHRDRLKSIKKEEKEKIIRENKAEKVLFLDGIERYEGWENYRKGTIIQSNDFAYRGIFSLKKGNNGDPHGGFKKLNKQIGLNIMFSGWIFRPAIPSPSLGDRLAIEDADFNGYGFCIAHNSNKVLIERRDKGNPTQIGTKYDIVVPKVRWYQFKFYMKTRGRFHLELYDRSGKELVNISSNVDATYKRFDQVAVHGGFPYYVDELKIETLS